MSLGDLENILVYALKSLNKLTFLINNNVGSGYIDGKFRQFLVIKLLFFYEYFTSVVVDCGTPVGYSPVAECKRLTKSKQCEQIERISQPYFS